MNPRVVFALSIFAIALGACAAQHVGGGPENGDASSASKPTLVGSAWRCEMDGTPARLAFLDGWLATDIDGEIFWAKVTYDDTGQRVATFENTRHRDETMRIERYADRLELEAGGEILTCRQPIEPFVTASSAPSEQAWETAKTFRAGDLWWGHYGCAQGSTDAVLSIDRVDGSVIFATFKLHPSAHQHQR